MTSSSANSVGIIGTLAESPHAPAVSHRLSVIPISSNSALLRGLLALEPTCLSSHSKVATINYWTRILCNTSCVSCMYLKATREILASHDSSPTEKHPSFTQIIGFLFSGRDDARPAPGVYRLKQQGEKKSKKTRRTKRKAGAGGLWRVRGFFFLGGSSHTLSFIT